MSTSVCRLPVPAVLLACLAVGLATPPPRAAAQEAVPFGQGTHAFRRILFELHLTPVDQRAAATRRLRSLPDPAHTLVIILGDTTLVSQDPGAVEDFLKHDGSALIATDRPFLLGAPMIGGAPLNVTVQGEAVVYPRADKDKRFDDLEDCPFLEGDPAAPGNLFRAPPLPGLAPRGLLGRVATNRPSFIPHGIPAGLSALAWLPKGCWRRGWPAPEADRLLFGLGGPLHGGRLIVLADHSLFINDMMLQPDADNIDFAYNCIDYLTEGGKRDQVLFVEEGEVNGEFNIPLQEVPLPELPTLDALVPLANQFVVNFSGEMVEDEATGLKTNRINQIILNKLDWPLVVTVLGLIFTFGLGLYGLYRLSWSRFRIDPGAPLLHTALARAGPVGPHLEQRHLALLQTGNLWEPARALARECWADLVGDNRALAVGAVPAEPAVRVRGGWWRRRALRALALRLWRLAYGAAPQRVTREQFARLPKEFDELKRALGRGDLELDFSGGDGKTA
jgi:hypothetical protein